MQARTDIEGTKKRIAESKQRIVDLEMVIGKNYWWVYCNVTPVPSYLSKQVAVVADLDSISLSS